MISADQHRSTDSRRDKNAAAESASGKYDSQPEYSRMSAAEFVQADSLRRAREWNRRANIRRR
jgi:hypothetical protein